jgi:CBS domain-containing protein
MSLHTQKEFLKSHLPFDKLTDFQINFCLQNIDMGYYPKDTVIISPEKISDKFFIIIKGEVNEYVDDELVTVYHEDDSFDADSLMYGKTKSTFKVNEDLICYELSKDAFLKLLEENDRFKRFYLQDLSDRLQKLKIQEYANDMSGFMVAKVNELYLHKPCLVSENTSIIDAISRSIEYKTSTIIVETANNEYGIVTDSLLKKDVLLQNLDLNQPIKQIAKFPFICVDEEEFLFQVLLTITEHNIKRVGVIKNGKLQGIIEQIDVLSYFANHVQIVATQIDKAIDIDDLKQASLDITKTVKSLYIKSVRTTYIAKMVAQLNAKVYKKLFELVVPDDLQDKCSLLVMGSEGRNEQILKTDQDNALIVKDGIDVEQFRPYMNQFSQCLIDFGFPKCDGDIMVNNPYWCKSYTDFQNQIDIWFRASSMEDYMNLAIFFDAKTIAGDCDQLGSLKDYMFTQVDNKDVYLAYFAKNTILFDTPIGMFSNLIAKNDTIDLKKGAIFALVQGIRSLAFENKIKDASTISRIKALNKLNILKKDQSAELIEAFGLLLRLKLDAQMKQINAGKSIDNNVQLKNLSKIQRDMLKDSFQIVNKFKKFIIHHFKLNNLM